MLEKHRQQIINNLLSELTFVSVKELSLQLESSEATIRRDLKKLASTNKLRLIRGGAQVLDDHERVSNVLPQDLSTDESNVKRAIAQYAVSLCADGESVIINGGAITGMMANFLSERRLNILTNSFNLARDLLENSQNLVSLPGGEVYRDQSVIMSSFENDTTQHFRGSKMFMSAQGVNEFGVVEDEPLLILAQRKLRRRAETLIVLADSNKIGIKGNLRFCELSEVDILITDADANPEQLTRIERHGVKLIVVSAHGKTG